MSQSIRISNIALDQLGRPHSRRDILRYLAAGTSVSGLPWFDCLSANANTVRQAGKACIVLWMQGGPSQFETFSPQPGHANGGETQAIKTSVAGIQIAEHLPQVASMMKDICVIRSMTGKEGSHPRATYLAHTGYLPTSSIKHPALGSLTVQQLSDIANELPSFVRVGGRFANASAGGFLGVDYDPLVLTDAEEPPRNSEPTTDEVRYRRRLALLGDLEQEFTARGARQEAGDHSKLYGKASRMILSPQMSVFDLEQEPAKIREAYGATPFGAGCLMARRLVEAGVTFVEVELNGWDTHDDNFGRCKTLCEQLDGPYAQLLRDLKQRGMLDSTLVVWMGEFGRTPRVNPRAGRDHYPRAFNVALSGCGVVGGQVIGRLDGGGTTVTDQPVTVQDLLRTVCHAMGVNADHENMSGVGRPIKVVDGGAVVAGVLG